MQTETLGDSYYEYEDTGILDDNGNSDTKGVPHNETSKEKMVRVHQLKEKMELEIVRLLNMLQSIISKSVYLLVIPIRMNTLSN